jgi:hypothetical protein
MEEIMKILLAKLMKGSAKRPDMISRSIIGIFTKLIESSQYVSSFGIRSS